MSVVVVEVADVVVVEVTVAVEEVVVVVEVIEVVVEVMVVVGGQASSPGVQSVAPTQAFPFLFVGFVTL